MPSLPGFAVNVRSGPKNNEANKALKSVESWKVIAFFPTKLVYWANEAFRILPLRLNDFNAEYDFGKEKMPNVDIALKHVILAMSKFFELLNNCYIGDMDELSIAMASRNHNVFLTYVGRFETFEMAPKASPFLVIEARESVLKQQKDKTTKIMKDASWFASSINAMRSASHMAQILTNFIAYGRDQTMSEHCANTLCETVRLALTRFEWSKMEGGT